VHTTGTDEPHGVEMAPSFERPVAGGDEGRPFEERPVGNRGVDAWQVLQHRPSGSDVEVTDLRVAHLAGRQSDGLAGGLQDGVRPTRHEATPDRRRGGADRIRVGPPADPEAVDDDEDDRSRPSRCRHARRQARAAAARPAAVMPARATMPAISSGFSDAPPTSAPSIDGSAMNSSIAALVTEPP